MKDSFTNELRKRGNSKELIVVLHAYMSSPKKLASLIAVIEESFPDGDIFAPRLSAGWGSLRSPDSIVKSLILEIDKIWLDRKNQTGLYCEYDKILFVGHSLGALLARQIYVEASGTDICRNSGHQETKPWGKKIERIILLAGMNRGWQISHHLSLVNTVFWSIGVFLGFLLKVISRKEPLIFSIRKGAPFITQLRIGWISMRNRAKQTDSGGALTIQLLGTVDNMVSPDDNIDLISGHDFVYLDVPQSGHKNIVDMSDSSKGYCIDPNNTALTVGELRKRVFLSALKSSKHQLEEESVLPSDIPLQSKNENVTDVVFVIHGIRDKGFWTHKIARNILKLAKLEGYKDTVIATETSSYGYFPILSFLLPSKRRVKVEWLMDQYAESMALYPNAEFSFVGHSNGTYLLAKSLKEYPFCKFKNVVFAGSVVRTNYGWEERAKKGQIKKILNYVATTDWVVAYFPKAIELMRLQDLGSAGHDGFAENANINQITYIKGFHGAALNEANWESISRFVLTGEVTYPPTEIMKESQSWVVKLAGLAPLAWVLITILLAFIYCITIYSSGFSEFTKGMLTVIYLLGIFKVLASI